MEEAIKHSIKKMKSDKKINKNVKKERTEDQSSTI
jgi:hypothetical protein